MELDIFTPDSYKRYAELKEIEFIANPDRTLSDLGNFSFILNSEISEFMNNVNIVGSLLSFNNETDTFTIWNCKLDEWDPYNEWKTPEEAIPVTKEEYGELIAVCVGKGLWCNVTIPEGLIYGNHKWANNNTELFNDIYVQTLINKSGFNNTNYILTNTSASEIIGTVWEQVKTTDYAPNTKLVSQMYIPSNIELAEMQLNISSRYNTNTNAFYPTDYGEINIGYLIFKQLLEPAIKAVVLISSTDYCVSNNKYLCYDFRLTRSDAFTKDNGGVYMVNFIHF